MNSLAFKSGNKGTINIHSTANICNGDFMSPLSSAIYVPMRAESGLSALIVNTGTPLSIALWNTFVNAPGGLGVAPMQSY